MTVCMRLWQLKQWPTCTSVRSIEVRVCACGPVDDVTSTVYKMWIPTKTKKYGVGELTSVLPRSATRYIITPSSPLVRFEKICLSKVPVSGVTQIDVNIQIPRAWKPIVFNDITRVVLHIYSVYVELLSNIRKSRNRRRFQLFRDVRI